MLKYKDVSLVVETTKCQHLQKVIHVHSTYMAFHIYKMCCIVCTYHLNTHAGCKRADRESKRFQIEIRTRKLNSGNSLMCEFSDDIFASLKMKRT